MKAGFALLFLIFAFSASAGLGVPARASAETYYEILDKKFNESKTPATLADFPSMNDEAGALKCLFVHERNPEHAYKYVTFGTMERKGPGGPLPEHEEKVVFFGSTEKPNPEQHWSYFENSISADTFYLKYKQVCEECAGAMDFFLRKHEDYLIFKLISYARTGGGRIHYNGFCEYPNALNPAHTP